MFSHVVIFWTDPAKAEAEAEVVAGAEKYLKPIPNILHFHVGKMVPSLRGVVDQSYQVALNLVFESREEHDAYQAHPLHKEFLEKVFSPYVRQARVYDFA